MAEGIKGSCPCCDAEIVFPVGIKPGKRWICPECGHPFRYHPREVRHGLRAERKAA